MRLDLPIPDLLALVTGEVVAAFGPRRGVDQGDEVDLAASGSRPADDLKPAYRHWADREAPAGAWSAVVEAVHPAALLNAESGDARHVLVTVPEGDLLVLRVYGTGGPVLSDAAFAARRRSLEGALGG